MLIINCTTFLCAWNVHLLPPPPPLMACKYREHIYIYILTHLTVKKRFNLKIYSLFNLTSNLCTRNNYGLDLDLDLDLLK
jgi:hypothetical protein